MRLKNFSIYHPLLLAGLPFLTIINGNQISLPDFTDLALPFALTLVIMAALWAGLNRLLHNASRAALVTTFTLIGFFYYGHLYIVLGKIEWLPVSYLSVGILWGLLYVLALRLALRLSEKKLGYVTSGFNQIGLIVFAVSLTQVIYVGVQVVPPGETDHLAAQAVEANGVANGYGDDLPDVYFIVLDEFPREDVLREYYDYDNSAFADSLEELGFVVLDDAYTNYTFTTAALPAILNMQYVQDLLGEDYQPKKRSPQPLFYYMRDNAVCRTFNAIGYHTITFDSTWYPTGTSLCADEIRRRESVNAVGSEYMQVLRLTSLLRPLHVRADTGEERANRLFILDGLLEIPQNPEPTFTFAHILLPHRPFLFDANGDIPESKYIVPTGPFEEYAKPFVDQVIFTSAKALEVAERLIAESDVPPIIIIQSDHGPRPFDDTDVLKQRPPILNAYYLPHGGDELLYPGITPVNSFRLIFDYYFGADLPFLEDRTYHAEWFRGILYDYQEVDTGAGG